MGNLLHDIGQRIVLSSYAMMNGGLFGTEQKFLEEPPCRTLNEVEYDEYKDENDPYAPAYGEVISVKRTWVDGDETVDYAHFGIYSGKNKVIHYHSIGDDLSTARIEETSMDVFLLDAKSIWVHKFEPLRSGVVIEKILEIMVEADHVPYVESEEDKALAAKLNAEKSCGYASKIGNFIGDVGLTCKYNLFPSFKMYRREECIKRARSRMGQGHYSLMRRNCEHFARWCKTGVEKSIQVEIYINNTLALEPIKEL